MRFFSIVAAGLVADAVVANTWIGKNVYNNWHKTELERWLDDHNLPYPSPADRKDLENIIKDNWHANVAEPYTGWDVNQLQAYLGSKGQQIKKGSEKSKDSLVAQVKSTWSETEDQATGSYNGVKEWIFNSWSDSQLKSFLDHHGIPNPQPHTRDSMISSARENYHATATKLGEKTAYPGNWIYEKWSESDLKAWLDERGIPVPQPTTRDKLVAAVRRNSRLASINAASVAASASASAASARASLSDAVLNAWSDSQLKEWADKNGIKVPQGSKRNELLALARKHRAQLTGDSVVSSGSSYYGAATSSVSSGYARATDDASLAGNSLYDTVQGYVNVALQKLGYYGSGPEGVAARASASASSAASSFSSSASASAASVASSASASASAKAKQEL